MRFDAWKAFELPAAGRRDLFDVFVRVDWRVVVDDGDQLRPSHFAASFVTKLKVYW